MTTSPLTQIETYDWSPRTARHLLNRAGFGVPYTEIDRLAQLRPERAVGWFVDFNQVLEKIPEPDWLLDPDESGRMRMQIRRSYAMNAGDRDLTEAEKSRMKEVQRTKRMELKRAEKEALMKLKGWWLRRMIATRRPLQEKLALFWHGHYAVSA